VLIVKSAFSVIWRVLAENVEPVTVSVTELCVQVAEGVAEPVNVGNPVTEINLTALLA